MTVQPDIVSRGRRPFVAFDFDGVLHEHASWRAKFGAVDFTPLRLAHQRGWAVAIMTAHGDLAGIVRVLREHGFAAAADYRGRYLDWQSGNTILVSGHKVWADFIVDDRAREYHYGEPLQPLFERLDADMAERQARRQAREARR